MSGAVLRFILGAVALSLVIDIVLHLIYKVYAHFGKNRLLDEYTDASGDESPPLLVRLAGLAVSVFINILIYFLL